MGWLLTFFKSSIGKKLLMSLTGLFLCSFLLIHLAGNFSLFVGKDAFNTYTNILSANPLIKVAEIVMIIFFLIHLLTSSQLTLENRSARPEGYAMDVSAGSRTFMSSYMFHTGSVVLIFLVIHIITFKYGNWSNDPAMASSIENQTLYDLVVISFGKPYYALGYIAAMIGVGFHLNHAFQSAFQTLGLNHKKYTPIIKSLGTLYSIVIAIGFAIFPAYFLFINLSTGN
jgi:succinate dehydrogenase / fumarate reductase, cytochrome b subunit